MPTRTDVAFVIPVYNEATVVGEVVGRVREQYETVVCVDDCSTDESAAIVERTGAYVVSHPINMGQGAALQTGIEFVRTLPGIRYVVTYDADGQHRLSDVAAMLERLERGDVDIVLGSRFLGQEAVDMPRVKRAVLKAAIAFSNLTSGVRLTDTHNGLRAFTCKVAASIQITQPGMAHASEMLEIIRSHGFTYAEIPVTIVYTDYSTSKGQPIINSINIAFDALLRKVAR